MNGEKMEAQNQEISPGEEEQEGTEPQQQPQRTQRPQTVTINTPLDKPEFDWFLDQYMKKLGITDRTQAAVSLTNLFYDMGLDPYADLKDLQQSLREMNSLLQGLPDTPATNRVKDTLSGLYAAKAGRLALERMPQGTTGEDKMQDRMDKIMEKYLPMILTFKMMGTVMSGEPGTQKPQEAPAKTEISPEVKEEMAAIRAQLKETQDLLRQQTEERQRKQEHDELLATISSSFNPQIDALRNSVESIASQIAAKELEHKQTPQASAEYMEISRQLKEAIEKIGQKEAEKNLNLSDLNTFIGTLETLEKRIKKEPIGEFDWKSATVTTLGEIGKEAVSVFKDIQASRPQQTPNQMQSNPQQNAQQHHEAVKRQVQNYIMGKISAGATEMNIEDAAKTIGVSPQEVNDIYSELVTEGWIKPRAPSGPQAPAAPNQPPGPQPEQTPQPTPQQQPPGGPTPVSTRNTNTPFEER
jgi:hypothetical protein